MIDYNKYEVWFLTGSQDLYGEETLKKVDEHSKIMVDKLNKSNHLPVRLIAKPVLKNSQSITQICEQASASTTCTGVIAWMHTFSPAKMWITGLNHITKPFLHLHTQFNRDIPWDSIDMDFMNLNQSAHGDREFGFIGARLRLKREIIAGFWKHEDIQERIGIWIRSAVAWSDMQGACIARFGDNMREVAVTEGDKVEAQIKFGYAVHGYGIGDLVEQVNQVKDTEVNKLLDEYKSLYKIDKSILENEDSWRRVKIQAKIEAGLRAFLKQGNFKAFTTTFENLYGLEQLPGLAVQRLMADGYGFGAEGDWKHAGLVRAMKVMAHGLSGGTSFMEDYTYHMEPGNEMVLGAHMLEICPSISVEKPSIEVHPLSIGGRDDPARLVFSGKKGNGLNVSLVDLGERFRIIVNEVQVVEQKQAMPKLPVARVLWIPKPNFQTGLESWILAGGAHHTGFSTAIGFEHIRAYANINGIECIQIGSDTTLNHLKKDILLFNIAARLNLQ